VPDYTTGQPFWEKAVGKENLVKMPWSDYGFDTYSMAIMASEKTMKERAKVLRDFLEASYMGWRDVIKHPVAAAKIVFQHVAPGSSTLTHQVYMAKEVAKLVNFGPAKTHGLGYIDPSAWNRTATISKRSRKPCWNTRRSMDPRSKKSSSTGV